MRKFSIIHNLSKLSMDRNVRILAGFAVLIISLSLLYKFIPPANSLLTWRDYPCYDDTGYPKHSVILINGKKYDLPIFKNPNLPVHLCPKNLNTFNETIVVNSASADYEWEIVLPDSSIVFYWEFPKQKNVSRHYDIKREYLIKKEILLKRKEKVIGAKPCVLVYNINLTEPKDTVLHFYYYNICEQDKPEAERHANYHLQIELKFKDGKVKV